MIPLNQDIIKKAYDEFLLIGIEIDINQKNLKKTFNISKEPKGAWFKCNKPIHQPVLDKRYLELEIMPNLKELTDYILELDSDLDVKETIIYISKDSVYKVKRGSIYPYKFDQKDETEQTLGKQKFRKLCDELTKLGNTRDLTRNEETYVVSKDNNGLWFRSGNIEKVGRYKKNFNLEDMPNLKILANTLNKQDLVFRSNGGRVFITPTRIYRVKLNIEINVQLK